MRWIIVDSEGIFKSSKQSSNMNEIQHDKMFDVNGIVEGRIGIFSN